MAMSASEQIGPWAVHVDWQDAHIEDTRNGEVFTAAVTRFPVGFKVSPIWTNGITDCTDSIPEHVKAKARALAGKLSD